MTKAEFMEQLRKMTSSMPQQEADRYTEYYSEMIDDAIEEGMSEQEAVASLGTMDEIETFIKENSTMPSSQSFPRVTQYVPQKTDKKSLPVWAIVLIIIGFPIWFSILCVLFLLYITGWGVIISLYAAAVSIGISGLGVAIGSFFSGDFGLIMTLTGAGLICIGLCVLAFTGLVQLSRLYGRFTVFLVKKCAAAIKGV